MFFTINGYATTFSVTKDKSGFITSVPSTTLSIDEKEMIRTTAIATIPTYTADALLKKEKFIKLQQQTMWPICAFTNKGQIILAPDGYYRYCDLEWKKFEAE